jgi:magnesium chelatase family protein
MHSKINSVTLEGITAHLVSVEVDMDERSTKAEFSIVGLPSTPIMESRKRITTALRNCGYFMPDKRITVNLSPADLKKDGTLFDLPITLGLLNITSNLSVSNKFFEDTIIAGELSLDGTVNSIKGSLSIASDAKRLGIKRIILPKSNAQEAALIDDIEVIGVESLTQVIKYLQNKTEITPTKKVNISTSLSHSDLDFDDVKGQIYAKRALQIAAAGKHNLIFSGPPGAGKTMLTKRILTIMPDMTMQEIIDTTKIYSISGKLQNHSILQERPFRSPHHTTTRAALIGGGSSIALHAGEISLSHNGILFLDEITEFKKECLESLREPLENGYINISRGKNNISYPCDFILIAAYNPCPCGFFGDTTKKCTCSPSMIKSYQSKLSGPLLDRIDIRIGIRAVEYGEITAKKEITEMSSANLKLGVIRAVEIQEKRFGAKGKYNSHMNTNEVEQYCKLTKEAEEIIGKAYIKLGLSARAYHKTLKLARTIADIDNQEQIDVKHISEALMYKFEQS